MQISYLTIFLIFILYSKWSMKYLFRRGLQISDLWTNKIRLIPSIRIGQEVSAKLGNNSDKDYNSMSYYGGIQGTTHRRTNWSWRFSYLPQRLLMIIQEKMLASSRKNMLKNVFFLISMSFSQKTYFFNAQLYC